MKIYILSFLLSINSYYFDNNNSAKEVRLCVEKYFAVLSTYMGTGSNTTAKDNHLALLNMHSDPTADYPCDLFANETDLDFDNYLREIDERYKNSVSMDYEITDISSCEVVKSGISFSFAFVKKILKYNGKEKAEW